MTSPTPTPESRLKEEKKSESIERILNRATPLDNSFLWREEVAREIVELFSQERELLVGEVEGMFSVYPTDCIHDFDEDEELISKSRVLALLKNRG